MNLNKVLALTNTILFVLMIGLGIRTHDSFYMTVAVINIIIVRWNLENDIRKL